MIERSTKPHDWVAAGVAYVDGNGTMQLVTSPEQANVDEWTEFSVGISTIPYVDYIVLYGASGKPAYKGLRFVR